MDHKYPLITIVTPSYNQGQFIEKTILSVLNQTYPNIQYIIVDGGSTDQTMNIIELYRDKIDIIINEKDKGQTDAINKGFRLAKGELVGWINSDDVLYPLCVEKIVELYLENPFGSIFYGKTIDVIDANSKIFNQFSHSINTLKDLLFSNASVIQQGSFYSTQLVKQVNFLDENIYYCMDLDLWLKLLKLAPAFYFKGNALAAFRIWEDTKTTTGGGAFRQNIIDTLFTHGAKWYYPSILQTYYSYSFIVISFLKKSLLKF